MARSKVCSTVRTDNTIGGGLPLRTLLPEASTATTVMRQSWPSMPCRNTDPWSASGLAE